MKDAEKIAILAQALRFYADPHRWGSDDWGVRCAIWGDTGNARRVEHFKNGGRHVTVDEFGGRRARKALKKCDIKTPNSWEPKP